MANPYSNAKLGLLTRILILNGSLNEVESRACLLYTNFNRLYNKNPEILEKKCQQIIRRGESLNGKALSCLLYQQGFFQKIERKMKHLLPLAKKTSLCYLSKKYSEAREYRELLDLKKEVRDLKKEVGDLRSLNPRTLKS